MRARTGSRLADRCRLAVYGASLLCLLALAVLRWQPAWIDAIGASWRHRVEQRYLQRLQQVLAVADPAAARRAMTAFAAELRAVRKEDRLAIAVRMLERPLALACARDGDLAEAVAHAQRLVSLDDRDLDAVALLGGLLGRSPATCGEGLLLLQRAAQVAPAQPRVVTAWFELLVATGAAGSAAGALLAAAAQPPSALWQVQWAPDPRCSARLLPYCDGDGIELGFAVDQAVDGLRFRLPPDSAMSLQSPQLLVGDDPRDVADLHPVLQGLVWQDGALVADGEGEPQLALPGLRLPGPATLRLRAVAAPRPPAWLRSLLLGPAGRAVLAEATPAEAGGLQALRATALRCARLGLVFVGDGLPDGDRRSVTLTGDGRRIALRVAVPAAAGRAQLLLPAGIYAHYRIDRLGCEVDGVLTEAGPLEPADLQSDAASLQVVGPSPSLALALPRPGSEGRTLVLEGEVR